MDDEARKILIECLKDATTIAQNVNSYDLDTKEKVQLALVLFNERIRKNNNPSER
jgi:hypothetical protein